MKTNWIVRNILLAVAIFAALIIIIFGSLNIITRHNRELSVPDFTNMSLEDAHNLAEKRHVRIEVTDSVFVKRLDRGYIFSQNPVAGSKVKKGRRILITINAINPQMVEMPSLVGFSLRQAKTELTSKGLSLGSLIYVEDIATNNVLEQRYEGKPIAPNTLLESESEIDLLLGLNPEDSQTYIPHLTGYTYTVAKDYLIDNSLNVGLVRFDETVINYTDSLEAVVYSQSPAFSESLPFVCGTKVSIYLTKDQSKLAIKRNYND
ncbi:MAG TPA: PASTA domain-containing protein [Bacteroidales bacterium]|nr:PASTA domain-containing protein [Bacteroidales bacterium]HPK30713.1 PASTA domain-containing protein [Bacteroidales bacterium]